MVISSMTSIMKSMPIKFAIKIWIVATAFVLSVQCQEDGRHYRIIKNARFKVKEDMMELDEKRLNLLKITEWRIACKRPLSENNQQVKQGFTDYQLQGICHLIF